MKIGHSIDTATRLPFLASSTTSTRTRETGLYKDEAEREREIGAIGGPLEVRLSLWDECRHIASHAAHTSYLLYTKTIKPMQDTKNGFSPYARPLPLAVESIITFRDS